MNVNQAFEILQRAGGLRAARIITENTQKFSKIKIWCMARALRRGVPVAKIIHQKWFYGMQFYTNRHTLDPRPDTETLVAAVISDYKNSNPYVLDLGTGTGCIIAAIVANIVGANGVGIEQSYCAQRVARKNIKKFGLDTRVCIRHGNFNSPHMTHERFDVIVSNPPYIAYGDTRVNDGARHDPQRALYAQNDGLAAYEHIARNAKNWICPGGKIYLEIGDGMMRSVRKIFTNESWKFIRSERDLSGKIRVLVFQM